MPTCRQCRYVGSRPRRSPGRCGRCRRSVSEADDVRRTMAQIMHRQHARRCPMMQLRLAPMALGLLAFATHAPAICSRSGTQIACDVGGTLLSIGTQRMAEPICAKAALPLQRLQGCDDLLDDHAAPEWPVRLEIQNIGVDPGLCRRLGNETYCYRPLRRADDQNPFADPAPRRVNRA